MHLVFLSFFFSLDLSSLCQEELSVISDETVPRYQKCRDGTGVAPAEVSMGVEAGEPFWCPQKGAECQQVYLFIYLFSNEAGDTGLPRREPSASLGVCDGAAARSRARRLAGGFRPCGAETLVVH